MSKYIIIYKYQKLSYAFHGKGTEVRRYRDSLIYFETKLDAELLANVLKEENKDITETHIIKTNITKDDYGN